jgi:hypothetical protein
LKTLGVIAGRSPNPSPTLPSRHGVHGSRAPAKAEQIGESASQRRRGKTIYHLSFNITSVRLKAP